MTNCCVKQNLLSLSIIIGTIRVATIVNTQHPYQHKRCGDCSSRRKGPTRMESDSRGTFGDYMTPHKTSSQPSNTLHEADEDFYDDTETSEEQDDNADDEQSEYDDKDGFEGDKRGGRYIWARLRSLASVAVMAQLLLCAGLTTVAYNEWCHYGVHWSRCNATFEVHRAFSDEPVCHRDTSKRHVYEQHELLNCTRAESYVISQPVGLCAMRSWAQDTYAGRLWDNMSGKLDAVTAPYLLLLLLALTIIVSVRTYLTERGKSDRKALEIEQYAEMYDRIMDLSCNNKATAVSQKKRGAGYDRALPPSGGYTRCSVVEADENDIARKKGPPVVHYADY